MQDKDNNTKTQDKTTNAGNTNLIPDQPSNPTFQSEVLNNIQGKDHEHLDASLDSNISNRGNDVENTTDEVTSPSDAQEIGLTNNASEIPLFTNSANNVDSLQHSSSTHLKKFSSHEVTENTPVDTEEMDVDIVDETPHNGQNVYPDKSLTRKLSTSNIQDIMDKVHNWHPLKLNFQTKIYHQLPTMETEI